MRTLLVIMLIFCTAAMGYAETSDPVKCNEAGRAECGVKDILFGWMDIPLSILKAFPRIVAGIADSVKLPPAHCDDQPVKPDKLNTQIR